MAMRMKKQVELEEWYYVYELEKILIVMAKNFMTKNVMKMKLMIITNFLNPN